MYKMWQGGGLMGMLILESRTFFFFELTRVFVSACLHDSCSDCKLFPSGSQRLQIICFTACSNSFALSGKLSYRNSSVEKGPISGFYISFNEIFNI